LNLLLHIHCKAWQAVFPAVVAISGQGVTTNSALLRHESRPVQHESVDMLSSQHLPDIAARPSSVFIVFHKGRPLVVHGHTASSGSKRSAAVSLMRLCYSTIASFLTDDNLIFLGTTKSPSTAETLSTNAEHCNNSQSCAAHFCVDLSKLSTDEVTGLCSDSTSVELIHPYSFLQLSSEDRKLFSRASPLLDWHRKNQFCPACGSATSMVHGGYKRVCQNLDCLTHKG